jgi:hypothetical protein
MYGRGFTVTRCLESTEYQSHVWSKTKEKMQQGMFDRIVACTTSNRGSEALPDEAQQALLQHNNIVWVDGNDINGSHEVPDFANCVFKREL